jgi:cobaltochelatase CobS
MTVPAPNGGTVWQDGQLAAAIRVPGAVILIDEPTVARDGALYVLQSVLDDGRCINVEETGEVIRVARDVIFLIADNTTGNGDTTGQYVGTRQISRALIDRCGVMVEIGYLSPRVEALLIGKRTGCPSALAHILVRFANMTRTETAKGNLPIAIGPRRLFAWAELLVDGVEPTLAAHYAFLNSAPPDAQEPLAQLLATHAPEAQIKAALAPKTGEAS